MNELCGDIIDAVLGEEAEPGPAPAGATPETVTGTYRPLDLMDPEVPLLHLLVNVVVEKSDQGLTMSLPLVDEEALLHPLDDGRFRAEGGFFDAATVVFEDDHLFAHMMRARRLEPWETANAFLFYAAVAALLVVSVPAVLVWRWVRRRRRGPEAPA